MAISNTIAQHLIWVLWAIRPNWKKGKLPDNSPGRHVIEQGTGNIIEYFVHNGTGCEETRINILVITGVGRVNNAANLARYEEYFGSQYNICIPNLPGYGSTSGKLSIFPTTEDQVLNNQKLILDTLGWDMRNTVFLGISYGSFVTVSTLKLVRPKTVILISPGKRIRQTFLPFGGLDYVRYAFLAVLARFGNVEALTFDTEQTLKKVNQMEDKPIIYTLHGSRDECIPLQDSNDLAKTYHPFYVTAVTGARHANTRFGEARDIIQAILEKNNFVPPKSVTVAARSAEEFAD